MSLRRTPILPPILLGLGALALPWTVQRVFFHTPLEVKMGTAQKIFYFHVPMAWICLLFALVSGIASGIELRRRSEKARAVATAAGEMVVLAGIGVLISGPIWGARTWGTPWTGDARQTATALLWLVFVAYILLKRFGPPNADRLAAAISVFGAVNVPIIYYAVRIWKTTHPDNTVTGTLPNSMRATLYPCLFALLLVAIAFVMIRARQERLANALDEAWVALDVRKKGSSRVAREDVSSSTEHPESETP
jgi:heme exporter protein C